MTMLYFVSPHCLLRMAGLMLAICFLCGTKNLCAATFPLLEPGTAYLASEDSFGSGQEYLLRLLDNNFFVLYESGMEDEANPEKCISGRWRQTADGSFLQLYNRFGFLRRLNVGAREVLYGDLRIADVPGIAHMTARKVADVSRPFRIFAEFQIDEDCLGLVDLSSGRRFSLDAENLPAVPALPKDNFFAQTEVLYTESGLIIKDFTQLDFPNIQQYQSDPADLAALVRNQGWGLILADGRRLLCIFTESGTSGGQVEFYAEDFSSQAAYELAADKISIKFQPAEVKRLKAQGLLKLTKLFDSSLSWKIEGDFVLLQGDGPKEVVLERLDSPF